MGNIATLTHDPKQLPEINDSSFHKQLSLLEDLEADDPAKLELVHSSAACLEGLLNYKVTVGSHHETSL